MSERRRSWWGWGWEDEALSAEQVSTLGAAVAGRLGLSEVAARPAPSLASLDLPPSRLTPPSTLAEICSSEVESRAGHTYGKSYRDVVRAFEGRLEHPPDVVARPRDEADVVDLLDWCADANAAAIPYGAGRAATSDSPSRPATAAPNADTCEEERASSSQPHPHQDRLRSATIMRG